MSRQSLIALGVAVVLGLVAVFVANSWLPALSSKAYASGTTKVAVATAPMAFGSRHYVGQGPLRRLSQHQHPAGSLHQHRRS